jgi:hypothetical protein
MLKTVLWIAGACAAVLVALAVSRSLHLDAVPAPKVETARAVAPPTVAAKPAPPAVVKVSQPEAKPPPTPREIQIQDDAAATGMTTVEPEAPKEPPPA